MQQIVNVTIDESGRSRASVKSIGIQYETGVAKFLVTPAPSWVNDDYFYYLIISPPEDSGNEQYAVPLINKGGVFEYQIGSGITWHVGNYKFAFIAMSEQLSSDGRVPTTGIVSISEAWTCNIESGILRLNELDKQPTDPNFTLLYDDLMALSVAVESKGNYAKTQGDYAKNIGDELKVKQEIGAFNGTPGSDGTSAGFGTPSAIVNTLEDNEDATVKVTASGEDTAKVFNFEFGIPKGAKGDKGEPGTDGINGTNGNDGANGKGIASIIRTDGTGEPGTIDTYTITYTDNTTSTYEVYNGKDGSNGEDGTNGTNGTDGITPHIGKNGNWWFDTVDTGVCATGGSYTLPKASADVLGGVKVGENLKISEEGVLSAQAAVIIYSDDTDETKISKLQEAAELSETSITLTKTIYYYDKQTYVLYLLNMYGYDRGYVFIFNNIISEGGACGIAQIQLFVNKDKTTVEIQNAVEMLVTPYAVLTITNTAEYTPTSDYHPATKKYVDDALTNIPNIQASTTDLTAGTSTLATGDIYLVYE